MCFQVNANEIRDLFARFGTIRDVKIISYRGGICKGYGWCVKGPLFYHQGVSVTRPLYDNPIGQLDI